jgi:hypothetical protein
MTTHVDRQTLRKQRQKLTKEQELKELRMQQLYMNVFSSPEGKEVFRDILDFCMTFQTTMTGNSWTYFNEGKRAVGLMLLARREKGWEQHIDNARKEELKKQKETENAKRTG